MIVFLVFLECFVIVIDTCRFMSWPFEVTFKRYRDEQSGGGLG